jgi:regulatory protein
MIRTTKKIVTPAEAIAKAQSYCAYQERSHQEVRDKLYSYGLWKTDVENILTELITSGFLNEERFAKAFAGGKFRMKQWGKNKIVNELNFRGISKRCVQIGLKEIDDHDYRKTLQQLLSKKSRTLAETNLFKKRDKVARYAIGKGFESELVWPAVMDLLPE